MEENFGYGTTVACLTCTYLVVFILLDDVRDEQRNPGQAPSSDTQAGDHPGLISWTGMNFR